MPLVNVNIKLQMENDYETDVKDFVKKYYKDLYSDYLVARRYSRDIKFNFCLGIGFIFRANYRPLGPFGAI